MKNNQPPGGNKDHSWKPLLYVQTIAIYANTHQKAKGNTLILNFARTMEYADRNKTNAYPKPTGKGIAYQAKRGKQASKAIEIF